MSDYGVAVLGDALIAALLAAGGARRPAAVRAEHPADRRSRRTGAAQRPTCWSCRTASSTDLPAPRPLPRRVGVPRRRRQPRVGDGLTDRAAAQTLPWVRDLPRPDRLDPGRAADADAGHRAARPGRHRELPDRARRWSRAATASRCCSAAWPTCCRPTRRGAGPAVPVRGRTAGARPCGGTRCTTTTPSTPTCATSSRAPPRRRSDLRTPVDRWRR